MKSCDTAAIDMLRGLSLQTNDLYVHAFLQDAVFHLEQHTQPVPAGSLYARLLVQSN